MARDRVRADRMRSDQVGSFPTPQARTPETDVPGGEEEEGGGKERREDVPITDQHKIERALMHLDFLEQEIRALVHDKSSLAGPLRRTAAAAKQQFDGDVSGWPPLKTVRNILGAVKKGLPK